MLFLFSAYSILNYLFKENNSKLSEVFFFFTFFFFKLLPNSSYLYILHIYLTLVFFICLVIFSWLRVKTQKANWELRLRLWNLAVQITGGTVCQGTCLVVFALELAGFLKCISLLSVLESQGLAAESLKEKNEFLYTWSSLQISYLALLPSPTLKYADKPLILGPVFNSVESKPPVGKEVLAKPVFF